MKNITFIKAKNADDLAVLSADFFLNTLKSSNSPPTIILPTGFTPLGFYKEVTTRYKNGDKNYGNFKYLALDEYLGLPEGDRRSFASWLSREILDPLEIPKEFRLTFASSTKNIPEECARMEKTITDIGSIDLAIIGLGGNGHVGFNEPGSPLDSVTRKIELTPETRQANAEYWGSIDQVPESAVTLGIGTLKKAKQTLLIVLGKSKAEILKKTFFSPISSDIPSTYLQKQENVTVIADAEALLEIESLIDINQCKLKRA